MLLFKVVAWFLGAVLLFQFGIGLLAVVINVVGKIVGILAGLPFFILAELLELVFVKKEKKV